MRRPEKAAILNLDWLDLVSAPVFVLALPGTAVVRTNRALRRVLGPGLTDAPMPLSTLIGMDGADRVAAFVRTIPEDGSRNTLSTSCSTTKGPANLVLHLTRIPDTDSLWAVTVDERTLFFDGTASDDAEETFRGIIQALPIGIDILDSQHRAVFYNGFSDRLYLYDGYCDLEMTEWFERAFPNAQARGVARRQWDDAIAALDRNPGEPQVMEWTVLCRDGLSRVLHNQMSKIGSHYAFIYWDVTEQRRLEGKLRQLAGTDMLTGVCSRREFFERAEHILATAPRGGLDLCLLMLDIDHFKAINDGFGHRIGDQALVAVAALCKSALRATDILARFGGEEFVVLLPHTRLHKAGRIAQQVLQSVSARPIPTASGGLHLTVSMGVASLDPDEMDIDLLIERADIALYAAKRAGRNRVVTSQEPASPSMA